MPQSKEPILLPFALTIIAAMMLRIMPLPGLLNYLNPDWVLLVLIYWSLALPERYGVFNAWMIGLLSDVLTGRLLGQYALIYSLAGYSCVKFHRRIRNYPLPQQSLFVFFNLLIAQVFVFWIENMRASGYLPLAFWFPVFTGTMAWPLVYGALRVVRSVVRSF